MKYDVRDDTTIPLQLHRPGNGVTDRFMQNIGWCIEQFKF